MAQRVFLSLGSNVGSSETFLRQAIEKLDEKYTRLAISSIYLTAPQDYLDQDDFYNLVACYDFNGGSVIELFDFIHKIENDFGRANYRQIVKGPRPIDIDIIYIDDFVCDTPSLTIPHKAYLNRNFVLVPLVEIIKQQDFEQDKSWLECLNDRIKNNENQKVQYIFKF